jgi:hypothetical protein
VPLVVTLPVEVKLPLSLELPAIEVDPVTLCRWWQFNF